MPNRHLITDWMIACNSCKEGHMGPPHVIAAVREHNWIVTKDSAVRILAERCAKFRGMNAVVGQQLTAPLPLLRTEQGWWSLPSIGVD